MNINQLEYFVTTVRERSYSSAAKLLYISPQAVSKAVGDLEKELQVTLLVREGREVVPSPFGEVFFIHATELIHRFTDLNLLVQHYGKKTECEGSLDIAVSSFGPRGSFTAYFEFDQFNREYPSIELKLLYNESGSCLAALEEGVVDAAIILGRTQKQGVCCMKLCSFSPKIALSTKHPLASRESIKFGELGNSRIARPIDLRFCYRVLTKQVAMHGIAPVYVDIPSFIKEHQGFIDSGDGVIFVVDCPEIERMYTNILIKPICEEERFSIPLCFAYRETNKNPALPLFETHLMQTSGQSVPGARDMSPRTESRKFTLSTSGKKRLSSIMKS